MFPIPTSFNISNRFTTSMDKNNYLSWRSQFMDVLELHALEDVITYETRPQKKLTDGTPNSVYSKDKLVLSWIKATTSSTIKTLLIPCTTAHKAWDLLEQRLSPLSKTYLHTLRDQICTLKRDFEQHIANYLMQAKSLFDSLTAARTTMSNEKFIEYILDRIGHEYKEFITSISPSQAQTCIWRIFWSDYIGRAIIKENEIPISFQQCRFVHRSCCNWWQPCSRL